MSDLEANLPQDTPKNIPSPEALAVSRDLHSIGEEFKMNREQIMGLEITDSNAYSLGRRIIALQHELALGMIEGGHVGAAPSLVAAGEKNLKETLAILEELEKGSAQGLKDYLRSISESALGRAAASYVEDNDKVYGEKLARMVELIPDKISPRQVS